MLDRVSILALTSLSATPKRSRIECTALFDNSINNPYNPAPQALVHFGDQTRDEMTIGFFDVTIPASADPGNLLRVHRVAGH